MPITLNGTTGIQTPLGSAGSPVNSNTTTPTTGVYYPSATTWGVSTAGTNALYIDASQNVGIGTTSPNRLLSLYATQPVFQITNVASGNTQGTIQYQVSGSTEFVVDNQGSGSGGAIRWMQSGTERMRIDSSGNLLVGTSSNFGLSGKFAVANASGPIGSFSCQNSATAFGFGNQSGTATYNAIYFYTNGFGTNVGSIAVNSASTSYNTTSDQRLKTNVQDAESALPILETIKIRQFDWVTTNAHERYGVVAQELEIVAPEAVSQGITENDMWAVDHSKLVPMLVKAIQELKAEFDAYKAAHP